MANPSEADRQMMSAQVNKVIWEAFDRMVGNSLETKRSHLERALLLYIDPQYFDNQREYELLSEKYGVDR